MRDWCMATSLRTTIVSRPEGKGRDRYPCGSRPSTRPAAITGSYESLGTQATAATPSDERRTFVASSWNRSGGSEIRRRLIRRPMTTCSLSSPRLGDGNEPESLTPPGDSIVAPHRSACMVSHLD